MNVISVKSGELVKWNPLTEELTLELITDDEEREGLPTIGYAAMFEYLNGFTKTIYWSREKMQKHAERYSKAYSAKKNYSFWEKDFDAMAHKTMLRQLISKWGVMSIEMQTAYEADAETEAQSYIEPEPEKAPPPEEADESVDINDV